MKQLEKEAAVKELMSSHSVVVDMGGFKDLLYNSNAMLNMFRKGAEWQSEQSPWISVTEQLPNEDEIVLCRMKSNGAIISGYVFISPEGYARVSTSPDFEFEDYGGYECDMWMPIPKFNE